MLNLWVVPAASGRWMIKREGSAGPIEPPCEYEVALRRGEELVVAAGGGHVIVMGGDGQARERRIASGQNGL